MAGVSVRGGIDAEQRTVDLRRSALFRDLGRRELAQVGRSMGRRRFPAGTAIVVEGEIGTGFFLVRSGRAKVGAAGKRIRTLWPGDHFGEIALILETPRTATVTAVTDVECDTLTSWDFRRLVETNAEFAWRNGRDGPGLLTHRPTRRRVTPG